MREANQLGYRLGGLHDFERLRIQHGIAVAPFEWNERYTPLDVNGRVGIVEQKGCYPGQEVIERTIAIGRPARRLVTVKGQIISPNEEIFNGGDESIGVITSVVQSSPSTRLGLAVIRSKASLTETYRTANESVSLYSVED